MDRSRVDPEILVFLEALTAEWAKHPPLSTLSFPEARRVADVVRRRWTEGGPKMAETREHVAETVEGPLRVRVYRPQGVADGPLPALVYMHGGGFVLFSLDTHDRLMREYAAAGGFVVLAVDYPLSPEARYPAALDRITAFMLWLSESGETLGIDAARLAIGGDSAGANLALATCLRLRQRGRLGPVQAVLANYGAFSTDNSDAAEAEFGGPGSVLDRAEMQWFWGHYLASPEQAADPFACPLRADLRGLPPTFLVIPELDLLTEQSLAMRDRLAEAGVATEARIYRGATHSFLEAMSVSALAREAIADGAAFVRRWLSADG